MKCTILGLLFLSVAATGACSSKQAPAPKPPEKTIFDPMIQTEQRARDVQKTIDAGASSARQAVAAQERGDASP